MNLNSDKTGKNETIQRKNQKLNTQSFKAGQLLYCKIRSNTQCCFYNHSCEVSWDEINKNFGSHSAQFLRDKVGSFIIKLNLKLFLTCKGSLSFILFLEKETCRIGKVRIQGKTKLLYSP